MDNEGTRCVDTQVRGPLVWREYIFPVWGSAKTATVYCISIDPKATSTIDNPVDAPVYFGTAHVAQPIPASVHVANYPALPEGSIFVDVLGRTCARGIVAKPLGHNKFLVIQ
jgi:hypothetical protein